MASSLQHAADSHDLIRVQGARENNLKEISVELPKRRLTVFTGVSGSGKSSLVFSTIAAESQRLINETYSAFVQGFMPTLGRPDVDVLDGLTTAIIVDQERMGANARSTVGTVTDANAMLRVQFSRVGKPHIGPATAFSFNVPMRKASGAMTVDKGKGERIVVRDVVYFGGMCPRCEGMGSVSDIDLSQLFDESKSLNEGARKVPGYTADGWQMRIFAAILDPDKPIRKYTKKERHDFLYKEPTKVKVEKLNLTYEGLVPRIQKAFLSKDVNALQPHIRAFVERAVTFTTCPECGGTRLNEAARSSKIKNINIADACAMQINDLAEWVRGVNEPSVAPLLPKLRQTLDSFVEIGLGYVSLDRPSGTLSGGEAQRTKMIGHLGSSLTDVTYVFDEPTIGLHPHDIQRMNDLLLRLRDKRKTVLVVEHKPAVIAIADHVVDLGPGAGTAGGQIVFEGTVDGLRKSSTLTGRHLSDRVSLKSSVRKPSGVMKVRGARTHKLEERRRRHTARRAGGGDRRGWIGEELADSRLGERPGRGGVGRPDPDPWLTAEQPGDLHGSARSDPQRVREGERREARSVQRKLRGRLSDLQRCRRDLHRPRDDDRRHHGLRGLRGPSVPSLGAELQARQTQHRRGARSLGQRRGALLRRRRGAYAGRA
jgi:excinuclease UvrABC ATPase subunit